MTRSESSIRSTTPKVWLTPTARVPCSTKVPNRVETLPKISTGWVQRTNVTDRRQTDGQQHIANSSFAKIVIAKLIRFVYPTRSISIFSAVRLMKRSIGQIFSRQERFCPFTQHVSLLALSNPGYNFYLDISPYNAAFLRFNMRGFKVLWAFS